MRTLLLSILTISSIIVSAQTGPGGVGNSSSNLVWLTSDYITGIADGNDISTWSDFSGNGNDFSQPNTLFTPEYQSNIVNGKPVVRFNKTNGRLRKTGFTTFPTTEITEIFVNSNNSESNDALLSYASSAHNNDFLLFSSNNLGVYRGGSKSTGISFNDNNWHIIQLSRQQTNGTLEVWKDGSEDYSGFLSSGVPITAGGCLAIAGEQDSQDGNYVAGQAHLGDFTEVLVFNTYLNQSQHIIIANYLSAKYSIPLAENDLYTQDDSGSGDFDHEVAGIGRISSTDLHDDAQGSSIVRILNPTNLDDNEFLIWGHDNATLGSFGSTDFPASLQSRLHRVWRASETNKLTSSSADVGNIDIRFDLSGLGAVTLTDLRLLIDSDNDGVFIDETPIAGAIHVEGNIYQFTAQSGITDNLRFTLGTINKAQTPLPIKLLSFDVTLDEANTVKLNWTTLSEVDNDYFTIEKSNDAINWKSFATINGAGNSNSEIDYQSIDKNPFEGINYYRLKQTDFNRLESYSTIRKVNIKTESVVDLHVYPNPSEGLITIYTDRTNLEGLAVYNSLGQKIIISNNYEFKSDFKVILNLSYQPKGIYYIISGDQKVKFIKK